MPNVAVYSTYQELEGRASSLDEFRRDLSHYDPKQMVYMCAIFGALLETWRGGHPVRNVQRQLIQQFCSKNRAFTLNFTTRQDGSEFLLFHRQQLLFVAKEAMFSGVKDGASPLTDHTGRVGELFLKANDQLHHGPGYNGPRQRRALQILADFIPVIEASDSRDFIHTFARAYLMFGRFTQELADSPLFIDVKAEFKKLRNIDTNEFMAICFASLNKYLVVDWNAFVKAPDELFLKKGYFRKTSLPEATLDIFKDIVSATPDSLAGEFKGRAVANNDFTCFRDKPLVDLNERVVAIDVGFLAEKMEHTPFWHVLRSRPRDEALRLLQFWGLVFEKYVDWLFLEHVRGDNQFNVFYRSPCFENTAEQVCDAMVVCDDALVLIEYKGTMLTSAAKYSGSIEVLQRQIEQRFVENDKGERKGIRQLSDSIGRLFSRRTPEGVAGLDLSKVTTVYPLLITRDGIGDAIGFNAYLSLRFKEVISRKGMKVRVAPLFTASIDSVEFMVAFLRKIALSELLHGRYREDPELFNPFRLTNNNSLKELKIRRNDSLTKAYDEFMQLIVAKLFPDDVVRREVQNNS